MKGDYQLYKVVKIISSCRGRDFAFSRLGVPVCTMLESISCLDCILNTLWDKSNNQNTLGSAENNLALTAIKSVSLTHVDEGLVACTLKMRGARSQRAPEGFPQKALTFPQKQPQELLHGQYHSSRILRLCPICRP